MTNLNIERFNKYLEANNISGTPIYEMKDFNSIFSGEYVLDVIELIEKGSSFDVNAKYFLWGERKITTLYDDKDLERYIKNMCKLYPGLNAWMEAKDDLDQYDIELLLKIYNTCCEKKGWNKIHLMGNFTDFSSHMLDIIERIDFSTFSVNDKYYTCSDTGIISIPDDFQLKDIFQYHHNDIMDEINKIN